MINFDLTDEQRLLEQSVREWGAREIAPHIREADRAAPVRSRARARRHGEARAARHLGAAGVRRRRHGLHLPRARQRRARVRRHVAARDHVGARRPELPDAADVGHRGSEAAVSRAAGAGTQDRRLRPDRAGARAATCAASRRRRSRRATATCSTARRCGSRWPTSPTTSSSSPGPISRRRSSAIPSGISAFIVERAFKGFSSGPMKEKWGILAGNTGCFKMDDVEVPEENLLGRPGEGFKIAMFALDQGRYTVAAGATGLIRACRDASVKYAQRAADLRRRDRPAPAREGDDRADGVGLSGVAAAVAAIGLAEERRPAQHARDRPGEVVRDGRVGARGRRRRADSRRQRLLRRVSGRPLLPQLQGRGHLRRHARDSQADAGRLPARLPRGPADALRAAGVRGTDEAVERRSEPESDFTELAWIQISRSSSCASSNRRPSPARTRWGRAIATGRIRSPSKRCAA